MMEAFTHYDLRSGVQDRIERGAIRADVLPSLQPAIAEALEGLGPEIHAFFWLDGSPVDDGVFFTIYAPPIDGLVMPVVTIGMSPSPGLGLWRMLLDELAPEAPPLALMGDRPPSAPWVATRPEIGLALLGDGEGRGNFDWLPEFTAYLAWAWFDQKN